MQYDTPYTYSRFSKVLHWLSALLIFALFGVGFWMVDLSYYDAGYQLAPHYHNSIGITLGGLILVRVLWRIRNTKPSALASHSTLEKSLSYIAHLLLYLLIFSVLIVGYLISTEDGRGIEVFNWFTLPSIGKLFDDQVDIAGNLHRWLAYTLITLSSLHGIAAFKHHYYDKDETLKRML
jgi:cytochrome b561